MRLFCTPPGALRLLLFFALTPGLFATTPIQGESLRGAGAAEARQKLLAAAENYLGTPYRFGGIDRRGLDCSGLVYLSFNDALHYPVPRTSEALYNWAQKIPEAELQPGDLVFFVTAGSRVSHLGIYAGGGRFIHSASDGPHTGVIYSRLDESYWRRTFRGAGRALPWDGSLPPPALAPEPPVLAGAEGSFASGRKRPVWADPGFFVGFGASWNWGGGGEGIPTAFRGISAIAAAGYKWSDYRLGLELRPHFDASLGVFRLPFTLSLGTDILQGFVGPAYTFGTPAFDLENGTRRYKGGRWLLEAGISAAFRPIRLGPGGLSFYGELAWQSYRLDDGQKFAFRPDIAANLRVSTGIRYLWRV